MFSWPAGPAFSGPRPIFEERRDVFGGLGCIGAVPAVRALDAAGSQGASDELELAGSADGLAAVRRRELAVDASQVRLDGVGRDIHLAGDLGGVEHP